MRALLASALPAAALPAAASTAAVAAASFQDPLATPAMATRLAPKAPLTAIARAGDRLVAAGRRGHVIVSGDEGRTWVQAEVPVSSDLVALHFPTALRGWAVGHDGVVLATADGGLHWRRQADGRSLAAAMQAHFERRVAEGQRDARAGLDAARRWVADGPVHPLFAVWFADARDGFVGGAFGLLFRTRDGGETWEPWLDRLDNPKGMHLYGITGARSAAGTVALLAGEQGLAAVLDDGASAWRRLALPYEGSLFGVAMAPPGEGTGWLLHGMRGNAFVSDDRGANWRRLALPTRAGLTAGVYAPGGELLLTTQVGECLSCTDGGSRIARLKPAAPMPYFGLAPLGGRRVALVGLGGVRIETLA